VPRRARTGAALVSTRTPGIVRLLLLAGLFMMLVQIHRAGGAVIANELAGQGFSPSQIATVVSAMFLASALFQLPTGMLFDRYGARWTMAGLGLVALVGIVLFACSESVLGLSAGRFLIGVGHGGTIAGIYMLALTWVSSDRVATATGGMVAIAGGIGGVLATVPLLLALEALGHQRTFLGVAAATLLVTVAIGLFVRDAPEGQQSAASGRGETLAQSVRGLWAVLAERRLWPVFAMGACFTAPFAVVGGLWAGPYLVDVHGLGREQASFAVLAMVAAFHLGNLGYGPLERFLGTRKWTVVSGVISMIALLSVLAAWPGMAAVATVAVLVLYCLCTPFYPVLAAHCRAFVPLGRAGRAISVVNLTGLVTVFALQKLTGWMVEVTRASDGTTTAPGYRLVFVTLALALLLAVTGYLRVRDAPP